MDNKEDLTPMVKIINDLHAKGFRSQLTVDKDGLHVGEVEKVFRPDDITIHHFYRFEGESNPDDNAIVYAIETSGGHKGTLVDAYGPAADPRIAAFIKKVEDISK